MIAVRGWRLVGNTATIYAPAS